jgi:hypothetical protein
LSRGSGGPPAAPLSGLFGRRVTCHQAVTRTRQYAQVITKELREMTTRVFAIGAVTLALAACATTAPAPAGMEAGKFVSFDCEGQDFQARYSVDTGTVRVRSHSGAAELSRAGDDAFSGEGFKLMLRGANGIALEHGGKMLGKNCKRA